MSAVQQNKGEWSEFYAFLKLLAEGRINAFDQQEQAGQEVLVCSVTKDGRTFSIGPIREWVMTVEDGEAAARPVFRPICSQAALKSVVSDLLATIVRGEKTFEHNASEALAQRMQVSVRPSRRARHAGADLAQSPTADCAETNEPHGSGDIGVSYQHRNSVSGASSTQWLSVKSWLGQDPTLLNASSIGTRVIFKISNCRDIESISATDQDARSVLGALRTSGAMIEFHKFASSTFSANLQALRIENTVADLVLHHFTKQERGKTWLLGYVEQLPAPAQTAANLGLKEFLRAAALGMTSSRPWTRGRQPENYLVVDSEGMLLLILGVGRLDEYLIDRAYVDTPSAARHKFGSIEREGDDYFIALNFQIRLAKSPYSAG